MFNKRLAASFNVADVGFSQPLLSGGYNPPLNSKMSPTV